MFGVTLWVLIYRRTTKKVHGVIFAVACLLFVLSTIVSMKRFSVRPSQIARQHGTQRIGVDSNHVYTGFLRSEKPDLYFNDTTKETFKNAIYELQTLLGDGILVRREAAFSACHAY